jgi:ATP-dependent Clp protease ATP-binding subunit ClpC
LVLAEYEQLAPLAERLKQRIVGQDHVVDRVAALIRQAELGLSDSRRPLASFMFVGESGVGKTELAKSLAETLYPGRNALIKLDMSEYNEGFSVSKLLGSPAGYVGYKESNQFTDRIKMNPHCVVVFDEFDKAHHDVRRLLLQILEQGEIMDSTGRMISLRNAIIIMTTSYGAEQTRRGSFGFAPAAQELVDAEHAVREQLKEFFSPELLNRIDAVCLFRPLTREDLIRIALVELELFNGRLATYHTKLTPASEAIEWLLAREKKLPGARDVRRTVREYVERLMAEVVIKKTIKPVYELAVKQDRLLVK